MQEAIDAKDMKVLIPFTVEVIKKEGTQKISVGSQNGNENMACNQQGTMSPKEYKFCSRNHILCIIDTPGIGSIHGLQTDEENFDSILDFLSFYDKIHAICILLKAQQSRKTTSFEFCIKELLTHLHKSAAENILLCFTHSKNTFYSADSTLLTLDSFLKENKATVNITSQENRFFFDNEAVWPLAFHQNYIAVDEKEVNVYSKSWNTSVSETKRLLDYVGTLSPHLIQNTISFNKARRLLKELSEPLAMIAEGNRKHTDSAGAKVDESTKLPKTSGGIQDFSRKQSTNSGCVSCCLPQNKVLTHFIIYMDH